MAFYLGRRPQGDLVCFPVSRPPTRSTHGQLYTAVIGPFRSKVGALYYARYGRGNPELRSAEDVERLARADPRMQQAIVEESLTPEELEAALECAAQDDYEYFPLSAGQPGGWPASPNKGEQHAQLVRKRPDHLRPGRTESPGGHPFARKRA